MYDEQLTLKQRYKRTALKALSFISDKQMISIQYAVKNKRVMKWKSPERFTEKLQWCKVYYRDPLMTKCADKFEVREYVEKKVGKDYLIELYGAYQEADEIPFCELPKSFVIKVNNGSGTNMLVEDKNQLDIPEAKKTLNKWMERKVVSFSREWQYENIKPRIIVEKFLPLNFENDIPDYKFFCFQGKVFCLYVTKNYLRDHENAEVSFFDRDFQLLPYFRKEYKGISQNVIKPKNFEIMISVAETLAADFPHVRVDLYNIDGKIYFGELTFCTSNGYFQFVPDEFDFIMGKQFVLPEKRI